MAQRAGVERRWTVEEDELLLAAVANFGEHDNWKTVAQAVPGRTNKACRKRWLHSLSPTIKKSAWTASEDHLLIELYGLHGPKWSLIARSIQGRTDDACSKRYREALDPSLKKDEWTSQEDVRLLEAFARIGGKWGRVGQELGRSGLGCRNRHRLLERNRLKAQRRTEQHPTVVARYYPPESYPTALGSEHPTETYRAPSPQMPLKSPPMPFNYSSSSLSAALSDPPRPSLPLPPVDELMDMPYDYPSPTTSASPGPADSKSPTPELVTSSSASTTPATSLSPAQPLPIPLYTTPTPYTISPAQLFINSPNLPPPRPPKRFTPVLVPTPSIETLDCTNPPSALPSSSSLLLATESTSSVAATQPPDTQTCSPLIPPIPLSPADSPQLDLPPVAFSSQPNPLPPVTQTLIKRQKRPRKAKAIGETRLSCILPTSSNPELRAYACGLESCWPEGESTSSACYSTSKELLDHNREAHGEEPDNEVADKPNDSRPYRCALAGCGKSWKSLNGLQYHLQISTAHFQNAVSSTFEATNEIDVIEEADSNRRVYICTHAGCFKAYKQPSGLRYHLKHGHSDAAQLETVPPTLAREMGKKTRKMRRKDDS